VRRLIAPIIVLLLAPVGAALATPAPPTSSLLLSDHSLLALTGAGGEQLVRARGGERVSVALRLWRIETGAALELVPQLRARGALRYAEPDRKLRRAALPSDPLSTPELGYHLYRIGADRVEPPGPELQRFPLTIVDTGLDLMHQEFAQRPDTAALNEQVVRSPNRVEGYHGTIVASTAAAPVDGVGAVGVYPQVPLRVYDAGDLSDASVIAGIDTAVAAGPSVLNLSLGGPDVSRALCESTLHAFASGTLVVAASGNEFNSGNPVLYPASFPHVLTVGSTDRNDVVSTFSSGSPGLDLAAPGESIPLVNPTDPGYRVFSGTSFAAPMVAAAAAWVKTVRPELHVTQLFDVMRLSARDVAAPGYDDRTGFGILDIPAALALPPLPIDPQEPNDDVDQVTANRVFRSAKEPINGPRGGAVRIGARLDPADDPHDVYRLVVPARRQATVTVGADDDVRSLLLHARTPSLSRSGGPNRLATGKAGRSVRMTWTNRGARPVTILVDVTGTRRTAGREITYRLTVALRPAPKAQR
jgi:hypothetical protein